VHPYIIGPCAWWLIIKWNNVSAAFGSVGIVASFADKHLESLGYVFHEIYLKESEHKNEAIQLA
jgi:hypothetical protein